jgi:hypothetical protein
VDDAERYIEPVDVRNGEYRAYDATGAPLMIDVERDDSQRHAPERVLIGDVEAGRAAPDELAKSVSAFLSDTGAPLPPTADLREVLQIARRRVGFTR